jgi:hypothetical protein
MTTAHPTFADCLFAPATDSSHAWKIMRALDDAGFRAGFPAIVDGAHGVAVTGDAYLLPAVEKVRASVESYALTQGA